MAEEFEFDDNDDHEGGYTLEEYDVGPSQQQMAQQETSSIDFRMDAPPPAVGGGSMEQRLRAAGDLAPPEGMQLARPAPGCCGGETSQTGPKAVKADYEAAKQILRDKRMRANIARERTMEPQKRVTLSDLTMTKEEKEMMKKANKGSDEDSDDEDDAAFEKYKADRIAFVQNSLPRFGVHTRVSKLEFANLVKSVHELCYVVCHLYQNSLESCARLNFSFEALAPQFPHVRFCRLRSTEAIKGYSNAGLPTLLVYKGGKLVTSAVRCTEVLPKHFSDVDVARLLQAKGILTVPTGLKDSSSRLTADFMQDHGRFSDDENAEAEAENSGAAAASGGFNLFSDLEGAIGGGSSGGSGGGSRAAASSSSNSQRVGGGKLKMSSRRVADSGSDSD